MRVILLQQKSLDFDKNLKNIGVSDFALSKFNGKGQILLFGIYDISSAVANILKQEAISIGADIALPENVYYLEQKKTDAYAVFTAGQLTEFERKLKPQPKGIYEIAQQMSAQYNKGADKSHIVLKNGAKHIFSQPSIMGIVNATPDSFSDGGLYEDNSAAVNHGIQLIEEGADIIDIGGESTRPGAEPVSAEEELKRVIPVVSQLRKKNGKVLISIDTYKAAIAEKAVNAGADIINDISALRFDENMVKIVKKYNVPVVLMHMKGRPRSMQKNPHYDNVIKELIEFFDERIEFCLKNGISEDKIIIDPGIGFGKRFEDNIEILKNLSAFKIFGVPLLIGASRKSFLGEILGGASPAERIFGTAAVSALALQQGADIFRVHDVKANADVLKTVRAI